MQGEKTVLRDRASWQERLGIFEELEFGGDPLHALSLSNPRRLETLSGESPESRFQCSDCPAIECGTEEFLCKSWIPEWCH